jgi:hypothetical protein
VLMVFCPDNLGVARFRSPANTHAIYPQKGPNLFLNKSQSSQRAGLETQPRIFKALP